MEYVRVPKADWISILDATRAKAGHSAPMLSGEVAEKITGIQSGNAVPDGTDVTFGNVDGNPVEREEAYAVKSEDLNELGRIAQDVAGKNALMPIVEIIYTLDRAKFMPCGNAASSVRLFSQNSSAVGTLQEG